MAAEMYSLDYSGYSGESEADHRIREAIAALNRFSTGTLIDYGCGGGQLLKEARQRGWRCAGVEFSRSVAYGLQQELELPIITPDQIEVWAGQADVVVLNDVIEHMTDLPEGLETTLRLLKPGGVLIAQGPLEANPNLFMHVVAGLRRLRRRPVADMPPYHVVLATAKGQRELFDRVGLTPMEYRVYEVAWPAPASLSAEVMRSPRMLALYLLRVASRVAGRLLPDYSGNRYFYVGSGT